MASLELFFGLLVLIMFGFLAAIMGGMFGQVIGEYEPTIQLIIIAMIPILGIAFMYGVFGGE